MARWHIRCWRLWGGGSKGCRWVHHGGPFGRWRMMCIRSHAHVRLCRPFDDPDLALGFGDLQLCDVGVRDQINQGFEFAQVHETPCCIRKARIYTNFDPIYLQLLSKYKITQTQRCAAHAPSGLNHLHPPEPDCKRTAVSLSQTLTPRL